MWWWEEAWLSRCEGRGIPFQRSLETNNSDSSLHQTWQGKSFFCLPEALRFLKFPIPHGDEPGPVGVKQCGVKAVSL